MHTLSFYDRLCVVWSLSPYSLSSSCMRYYSVSVCIIITIIKLALVSPRAQRCLHLSSISWRQDQVPVSSPVVFILQFLPFLPLFLSSRRLQWPAGLDSSRRYIHLERERVEIGVKRENKEENGGKEERERVHVDKCCVDQLFFSWQYFEGFFIVVDGKPILNVYSSCVLISWVYFTKLYYK